ncbi:dihydrodipicolinate reductase [Nonlabens dokdonensis]|jgi:4-hydroxy-tetrahydrodipicolinate reductase|uniref:4-hydroxy-tetrahydrodipicolinate reductase n=2 Tax=Nonlabens dokdonensis TaxID=328515 RepID=L7WCL2_NONDD|nr:4-hydroxy-tetrahydrodipicolinate reductase [Nonlabens dokdonensis]AGC77982.1 dihydrodipicolinate reductase [Nonlabens dokdonensis DSW-6]PZX37053.1 dihydrodipicolinate reductase [Nonlabens dokdonensis]
MKIALLGYGKMGKTIERIAVERGHSITARIGRQDDTVENIKGADVVIEFTSPESVLDNLFKVIPAGIPIVCGTTGWNEYLTEIEELVKKSQGSMVHASNFSLGVNLFFELNKKLAQMMQSFPEYEVSMQEIHHTEKKDAPSGTAITLFEGISEKLGKEKWHLGTQSEEDSIAIDAVREEDVKGTHSVAYKNDIDSIEIIHKANTRDGFALGSVIAAEWIVNKKGIFTMKDVLGL